MPHPLYIDDGYTATKAFPAAPGLHPAFRVTYRPAVVMIGLDGRVEIIRERENLDYVQRLERVPDHLLGSSRA